MGSGLRQIGSCTVFSRKGAQFVRRARQIGACTQTHMTRRVLKKSPNEKAQSFREHPKEDHKEGSPT